MTEVAGDLWVLMIRLAGKMKRADECAPRIRYDEDRDVIEDFLDAGDRIWKKLKNLLKDCEEYMWEAATEEHKKLGKKGSPKMGTSSGCEFVESIFGRDRKLEKTQKLMQKIRLWNHRFDTHCEEILRYP